MNWIPVYTGNPGFGACPVLDTGVKPDNDKMRVFRQAHISLLIFSGCKQKK
jgi:hypothetical protein